MDFKDILSRVDHTLLLQYSTENEITEICRDGVKYKVASVCIPPSFVTVAKKTVGNETGVCTVVGFPNGYAESAVKVFETELALRNGADEIDTVINIGWLKDKKYSLILEELRSIKAVVGEKIFKVIIETCLLTEDEKIRMCGLVSESGADFIKTSTGFSTAGATFDDVALFKKHVADHVKIKAAGGISSLDDAVRFIELGADRLGTSRIVKLVKNELAGGY